MIAKRDRTVNWSTEAIANTSPPGGVEDRDDCESPLPDFDFSAINMDELVNKMGSTFDNFM